MKRSSRLALSCGGNEIQLSGESRRRLSLLKNDQSPAATAQANSTSPLIMQKIRPALITAVFVLTAFHIAQAQSDEKKFEVSGQFTFFRVLTRSLSTPGARLVRAD